MKISFTDYIEWCRVADFLYHFIPEPKLQWEKTVAKIFNGDPMKKMTAGDWQIYQSMQGSGIAASILTRLLEKQIRKAKEKIAEGYDASKQAIAVRDRMLFTMTKLRKYGARNTEPECVLVETIEKELNLMPMSVPRY